MITKHDMKWFDLWLHEYCFQAPPKEDWMTMKDSYLAGIERAKQDSAQIQCSYCDRKVQCHFPEYCEKYKAILGLDTSSASVL